MENSEYFGELSICVVEDYETFEVVEGWGKVTIGSRLEVT